MRVIAGKYKSRILNSIKKSKNIRPTLDRVKESIFDIIGDNIVGEKFIDLFAGSGSIGIEAISRGAELTYFVEESGVNLKLIYNNLQTLNIPDFQYKVIKQDVFKFLKDYSENNTFKVIFADPPYNRGYLKKLLEYLDNFKGIERDSIVIFESSCSEKLNYSCSFNIIKVKKYGDTLIQILKKGG